MFYLEKNNNKMMRKRKTNKLNTTNYFYLFKDVFA